MGLTHSVPVPSNADFLVPHKPLSVPPLFHDKESNDSSDSSTESADNAEYSFFVPKDAWNKGASLQLTPLSRANDHNHNDNDEESKQQDKDDNGADHHRHHHPHHKIIKVVPLPDNDHQQCLITNAKGVVVAVLQVLNECIQICTLNNHGAVDGGETVTPVVVGQYQGQPLYEYAVVTENYQKHHYHHTMSLSTAAKTTATYQMAQCGPKWFGRPMGIVVQCHPAAAVDEDNSQHKKPNKHTLVGAYLTHQSPQKAWACRTSPAVDPVLLAAFVVCSDKQRTMFRDS